MIDAVVPTESPEFTFMRSLLLPNAFIYEPFFLPSPPASGGEGSGVREQSASRWRSGTQLRVLPRVPTPAPRHRERVFDGAAPSSPALLPREDRGRREPERFDRYGQRRQYERNESGLRHLIRFVSPGRRARYDSSGGCAENTVEQSRERLCSNATRYQRPFTLSPQAPSRTTFARRIYFAAACNRHAGCYTS